MRMYIYFNTKIICTLIRFGVYEKQSTETFSVGFNGLENSFFMIQKIVL